MLERDTKKMKDIVQPLQICSVSDLKKSDLPEVNRCTLLRQVYLVLYQMEYNSKGLED